MRSRFVLPAVRLLVTGALLGWLAASGQLAKVFALNKKADPPAQTLDNLPAPSARVGWWTNLAIGMVGAVVGGFLFGLLNVDLGLGELKISFEDLISAVVGSLICVFAWWLISRNQGVNSSSKE